MPTYSLIVPVYNEVDSLHSLWEQILVAMKPLGNDWEIFFVDDGSTDSSAETLASLATDDKRIHIITFRRNRGKAAALQAAFYAVQGQYIVSLDADLQDDPNEIPRFIETLNQGYDLVVGYKKDRHDPWHKTIPSHFFNALIRSASGLRLHDINCGLKAYRREAIRTLTIYGELYRFIPVLVANEGFRVTELPVHHRARLHGVSKYGISRFLRGFLDLITVTFLLKFTKRPLHLFGSFGVLLGAIGTIISLYLTILHFAYHQRVGERPLLLFGVVFIIAGIQMISTGLIAELITHYWQRREHEDR